MSFHHPISERIPRRIRRRAGFTLIELLSVVAIITLGAGLATSAVQGLASSGGLKTGARVLAGMLTVARSEAIARHTVVRFAVAMPEQGDGGRGLRRVGLWAWDNEAEIFIPISKWEELPMGVVLEPQFPEYLKAAGYAAGDSTIVQGDCILDAKFGASAEYVFRTAQEEVKARYFEFLPSGNLRVPGGRSRQAVLVATEGYLPPSSPEQLVYTKRGDGGPANWAQINIDSLTGRVRLYQP
jgi:prepilin-type N-terminal cleavage/methylation domain-containing protein